MNQTKPMTGIFLSAAQAAAVFSVLTAYSLGNYSDQWLFPLILIPYAPLLCGVNLLFLRKSRTVTALSVLNGVFALGLMIAVLYARRGGGITSGVMIAMVCIAITVSAVQLNLGVPRLSTVLLWVDINAAGMILMAGVICLRQPMNALVWCVPSAVGLAAAFCALISIRMENMSLRLRGILVLLLLGLGLLTGMLVIYAAEPAGQGITAAWNGLGHILRAIGAQIERFVEYLASLIPKDQFEESAEFTEAVVLGGDQSGVREGKELGFLLFYLLTGAGVCAAIAAAFVFGKRVMKRRTTVISSGVATQSGQSPLEALRSWVEGLKRRLETKRFLKENRNNALGLYFRLEKLCQNTALARQCGETPRGFLTRLSVLPLETGAEMDFSLLIDETDRLLFGGGDSPAELNFGDGLCRAIKQYLGRRRDDTIQSPAQQ